MKNCETISQFKESPLFTRQTPILGHLPLIGQTIIFGLFSAKCARQPSGPQPDTHKTSP